MMDDRKQRKLNRSAGNIFSAPKLRIFRRLCGWSLLLLFSLTARAQTTLTGVHYYVLINRATDQVVSRGTTGTSGVLFDQLVIAPNTDFRLWVLNAEQLLTGYADFTSRGNGQRFILPNVLLGTDISGDPDQDGLGNDGEFIMGTNASLPDTDGDGVLDGAEVQQGLDPLSGLAVRIGIIGSVDTPGNAIDVTALNNIAVVAEGNSGIRVFNVFNGMNPVLIASVDTPGFAYNTSISGSLIAVADGQNGLAVVDISDPPGANILHQVSVSGNATVVKTAGNIAYVGASQQVVFVDMSSGQIIDRLTLTSRVHDLAFSGDYLYVLTGQSLSAYNTVTGYLDFVGSVNVSGSPSPLETGRKLFVGDTHAYVGHFSGFTIVDVTNGDSLQITGAPPTTQSAIHDLAANGSGKVITTTSFSGSGTLQVSIYSVADPTDVTQFESLVDTPGAPRGLSIYNGLAYVADSSAGLQVVNYQSFDALGEPPSISLSTSFADGVAEEGKVMRVTANVSDDVQVRNVEFYVDGSLQSTDGNFPFEHRFVSPRLSEEKTLFTLQARASDTGGNSTWSEILTLELVPDATAPIVIRRVPTPNNLIGFSRTITAVFSEPIRPEVLSNSSFFLTYAGNDGMLDTGDDSIVPGGSIEFRTDFNTAVLTFPADFSPGLFRAALTTAIADLAGNSLAENVTWEFRVFSLVDTDMDGVPDELEPLLGLVVGDKDSDNDGILDGAEDFDQDGLSNAAEIVLMTNVQIQDTDGDGIIDGDEDSDGDALLDAEEFMVGTDARLYDSDNDGWNDESEVTAGSNPLSAASRPPMTLVSHPAVRVGLASATGGAVNFGVTVAYPVVNVGLASVDFSDGNSTFGTVLASPPVSVGIPSFDETAQNEFGTTIAQPPVTVEIEPEP